MLIPTGVIRQVHIVATQPVGAPDPMGFTITVPEGERGMLLGGAIGPDDYAAGRVVSAYLFPSVGADRIYSLGVDTVDNQEITLAPIIINQDGTSRVPNTIGVPYMPFILPELSYIQVQGVALANTETLSGIFWIAIRMLPLTIAAIGTGVILSTNTQLQV